MLSFNQFLNEDLKVTFSQLKDLEKTLDSLFHKSGIDIAFTKHFFDRINDARNGEQIKIREVRDMFRKVYARFKDEIAKLKPDFEGVLKDIQTKVNVPFHISWDKKNQELDLISKTIMRKDNFKSSSRDFKV